MKEQSLKDTIKNHMNELQLPTVTNNDSQSGEQEIAKTNSFEKVKTSLGVFRTLDLILSNIQNMNLELVCLDEKGKLDTNKLKVLMIDQLLDLIDKLGLGICIERSGKCFVFTGAHWEFVEEAQLKIFLCRSCEKQGVSHTIAFRHSLADGLHNQLKLVALPPKVSKSTATIIGLKHQTLVVRKGVIKLREHNKNDYLKHNLPYDYNKEAKAELFYSFLNKVLPNEKTQMVAAEYMATIFAKHLKFEKVLMLFGDGANGKSTMINVITAAFGTSNVTGYSTMGITDKNGYFRAELNDKFLNISPEFNGISDIGIFKSLASGERVEARSPYGKAMLIENYAKLIICMNVLTKEVEHTHGFWRRFTIIPFNTTITQEERDPELADRIIKSELSGVLNWILEGLGRLLESGRFTVSEEVDAVLHEHMKETDNVCQFVDENNYMPHEEKKVLLRVLYHNYREYCREATFMPLNRLNFKKRMERLGFPNDRTADGRVIFIVSKDNENVPEVKNTIVDIPVNEKDFVTEPLTHVIEVAEPDIQEYVNKMKDDIQSNSNDNEQGK